MSLETHENENLNSIVPSQSLLWTFRALCVIALSISGYLAWTAFTASEVFGCGGGESAFDCSHVLTSKYSKIWGIPVSVPAFALYSSLLGVLWFMRPTAPPQLLRACWGVLTFGAFSAALAATWFVGVQAFKLEHYCWYCLGAHCCGVILAGIVLWVRPLPFKMTAGISAASLAGIAVLVTAQTMSSEPNSFVMERFDQDAASTQVASLDGAMEFDAPTEFGAPVEFGAPMEFGAPVEFSAPSEVMPVEFRAPSDDQLFSPPGTGDVTSQLDAVDVPLLEMPVPPSDELPTTSSIDRIGSANTSAVAATASYLFFSPSSTRVAARLLSLIALDEEAKPAATSESTSEEAKDVADDGDDKAKAVATPPQPEERLVPVFGSRFSLNSRHWPLLGKPDAKYIFVEMFDYTCPHCRNTHQAIDGAMKTYGEDLAVIALPVPLERSCNDAASGSGHYGACELAKLSIAVWRIDQAKFKEFHDWMFESTRSTSEARAKAGQLVGAQALRTELALPHAGNYILKHVDLYKKVGRGAVPKLMFPDATMSGQVTSAKTLCQTIERELAAK